MYANVFVFPFSTGWLGMVGGDLKVVISGWYENLWNGKRLHVNWKVLDAF